MIALLTGYMTWELSTTLTHSGDINLLQTQLMSMRKSIAEQKSTLRVMVFDSLRASNELNMFLYAQIKKRDNERQLMLDRLDQIHETLKEINAKQRE